MKTAPLASTAVDSLRGVGPQLAVRLRKLGIETLQDLLFHLPLRYIDRTRISPIGSLQPMTEVVIEGEIRAADVTFGRRRSQMCRLQDSTGIITLRFFHFSRAQQDNLKPGTKLRCYGEVRRGSSGLEIYHPEYQSLDAKPVALEKNLTPIYPATEGITQQRIRDLCAQALAKLDGQNIAELIPESLLPQKQWVSLVAALRLLHNPPADAPLQQLAAGEHPVQQRLALEELVAHNLSLLRLRQQIRRQPADPLPRSAALNSQFLAQLPFQLTGAQQRVAQQVADDLAGSAPMLRLVQGDVGSGKTVIAALAALAAVANGKQAALMAPTEILAEQHRDNFQQWLQPLGIRVAWLSGKQKGKAREMQLAAVASGEAQIVIGTHALFQDEVVFADLALSIIDEQHRFGVHQRLSLRNKGRDQGREGADNKVPHQLIMTATPIPRTLAMSAYADLDCSVIDELPPGRKPVETVVLADQRRADVIQRVRASCQQGRQAYWVCTLIEESEALEAQAAEATADELQLLLAELNIGLVHGRLKPREKAEIMQQFKAGEINLLVATTVIEVGVDVPNASLMIIENAERLGLSQLHQLRGRVGRGSDSSHCVLLYAPPLSKQGSERLKIMRETCDGFRIAEKDLQLRGPGEVLGTRQTGDMQLHIADLQRDGHLLTDVRRIASALLTSHPLLAEQLIKRWIGRSEQYAQA